MTPRKILVLTTLLSFVSLSLAAVTLEEGTVVDPSESNSSYYMAEDNNFSQVTVYSETVNFSTTNVTTTSDEPVNVTLWDHNFSMSNGNVVKYNYNVSADTSFYSLNDSKVYNIYFNGSLDRSVDSQVYLNVTVPGATNLTVEKTDNSPPNKPDNPIPSDGDTRVPTSPTLEVDVSDPDGDSMNVTFYDGSDNLIDYQEGVGDGSTTSVEWGNLDPGTNYDWYVEVDDGILTNTSNTFGFTTNHLPKLDPDQQYYSNFSTNHEFKVESYANDSDGDSDFDACKVYYEEPDGESGLLDGTLDTSYGGSEEVSCVRNFSSSLSGVEVGESVTTSVRFYDGKAWANSSLDSNVVPNNPPTKPTSFTDLGIFLTTTTPDVQWNGEDDPDGDKMTISAYTGTSADPTTLDNDGSSTLSSLGLGQNVNLERNTTYYYRLRVCDEFGACSSHTSSDKFMVNDIPNITDYRLNKSSPDLGDTLKIESEVDDRNLESVNFTVWEGDNKIIDNENGTLDSGTWISSAFKADEIAKYNYSITAEDNVSASTVERDNFTAGYEKSGKYMKTYNTADQVRKVRLTYYGSMNDASITAKANTSNSGKVTLENSTWNNIESGQNITAILEFEGDGTSTPEIDSYSITYATTYKSEGYTLTEIKDFGNNATVKEVAIEDQEDTDTDLVYEFRSGSDESPPSDWSDWTQCTSTCDPGTPENRYFQYRANLSTTDGTKTPTIDQIEVKYE